MPSRMLSPNYLDRPAQEALLADIEAVIARAPLYRPRVPSGASMSVRMTNCGALGWITDAGGYRYAPRHPVTGEPWPPIPDRLLAVWRDLAPDAPPPEACLINYYDAGARMGLHQDRDEQDFSAPVVSVSLGDTCLFRLGGTTRKAPTTSFRLASGDAMVLAGDQRLAYHGVDRIMSGSSTLLPDGGRINLTLRRVTKPS